MRPRVELQVLLESILGTRNVYFQPPENLKLKYPCIIYEYSGTKAIPADNIKYLKYKKYTVTYIDESPVSEIPGVIEDLPHCSLDRHYVSDRLNHTTFTLYY